MKPLTHYLNPFRRGIRPIFLLILAGACTTERAGPEIGLLRFSIEVLRAGPNGQPQLGVPGTRVAYCNVPVRLPDGPRQVTASNMGMMVEASWDEITAVSQDSRGVSRVRIKNLKWHLLNPVRYGTRIQNIMQTSPINSLNVGRGTEAIQPPVKLVSGMADPEWQKNLFWVLGVSWNSGGADRAPEIDVVQGYLAANPALRRPPARPVPPPRRTTPVPMRTPAIPPAR